MVKNNWSSHFEQYVEKLREELDIPGIVVGLAKDGKMIYNQSFGYRDREKKLGVDIDTVYSIASITKSFTCVALLQLEEAGKISVHDPIKKYLPNFRLKNGNHVEDQITIHHFMTHTSSIPALPLTPYTLAGSLTEEELTNEPILQEDEGVTQDLKPIKTYEEYIDTIASLNFELNGELGEKWEYNNDCYGLLGAVVEAASGIPYEEYVKENIIDPIGMNRTSFFIDDFDDDNIQSLYVLREKNDEVVVVPSPNWWDTEVERASGFLKSTVRDMLKYTEIYRTYGLVEGRRILSEENVKKMLTTYVDTNPLTRESYGYGLFITSDYHGKTLVSHSGGIKSLTAQMYSLPEKGLTAIVFVGLYCIMSKKVADALINCYEGRSPDALHIHIEEHPLEEGVLAKFVGTYESTKQAGMKITVSLEEGQLYAYVNLIKLELIPTGKTSFIVDTVLAKLQFEVEENGEPTGLTYGGMPFKKV